ncbi:MAG: hypothetical protein WDM88_10295 [Galbitalea sp.]
MSRGAIAELRQRYARCVVVLVTVSDELRAERLRGRRRESAEDIAKRLARADPSPDTHADHEIANNGSIAEGTERLVRVIESVSD